MKRKYYKKKTKKIHKRKSKKILRKKNYTFKKKVENVLLKDSETKYIDPDVVNLTSFKFADFYA